MGFLSPPSDSEFWSVKDEGVFLRRTDAPELAQTMLQHGAKENGKGMDRWTPLFFAIVNRRPQTVEILLKHGVAINATTKHGVSALNIAVLYHKETPTVVPLLLAYGTDPNLPDDRGATALQQAKNAHRLGLVSLLQRAGAKK